MSVAEVRNRLVGAVKELPMLPQAVMSLLELDASEESYYEGVLKVAESAPSFAVRILALANSVTAAGQEPATTLRAAMGRIGSAEAADLILSLSVTRVFVPRDDWEKSLWRHAVQVAIASRALARVANDPEVDPDAAYVCGLLHDLGRLILLQEGSDVLQQIDEGDWDDPESLVRFEKSICGLTHAELGAKVTERWGIPSSIIESIRDHHLPLETHPSGSAEKLRSIITSADLAMVPSAMPGAPTLEDASLMTLRDVAKDRLPPFIRMSVPELRDMLRLIFNESRRVNGALGLT